jgi:carbonic anhydrase
MSKERLEFNRTGFLMGSLAALSAALPEVARSAAPAAAPSPAEPAERLLGRLMAGNRRFVTNDFPASSRAQEKRELLIDTQTPYAAILGCADSRVIPNLIFVQGLGDLFVVRVAGNYPDDLVTASLEYAIEHLGTRLIVVLGHQNCGAVKAVYDAIQTGKPLPPHLSTIQQLLTPGLLPLVKALGSLDAAIGANAVAAAKALTATSPTLDSAVKSGHVKISAAVYKLGSGEVKLLE